LKFVVFIVFCLYSCASILAQDSIKAQYSLKEQPSYVKKRVETKVLTYEGLFSLSEKHWLDTLSTRDFQNRGLNPTSINLGNVGSTPYSIVFNVNDFVYNPYTRLAFQKTPIRFIYIDKKPITYAEYQMGSALEQQFSFFHTQTIKENTNIMVGLDKINSKGFYINQATNNTHFYAHILGGQKKEKYTYLIHFDRSQLDHQLNGGIVNDEDFTDNPLTFNNKGLLQVNLNNAKQIVIQNVALFKHQLLLFKNIDTVDYKISRLSLKNDITYTNQSRLFYDTALNDQYYDYFNLSDVVSRDTIRYQQFSTNLGIEYIKSQTNSFIFSSKLNPSYNVYKQYAVDTSVFDLNFINYVSFSRKTTNGYAKFSYLLNDRYVNKDFLFQSGAVYRFENDNKIFGEILFRRDRPQLDMLSYQANNVSWDNNFQKTEIFNANINYYQEIKNFSIKLFSNYTDIKNPIFFNLFRQPQQIDGVSQVIQSGFNAKLKLKKWNFENQTVYQYTGGFQVIKIPQLYSNLLVEYTFGAFKNKMDVTLGTSINYYSEFEAPYFDPVTNQFYVASSYKVGNYPFVDVFFKARIQRVKIMLMSSHVNQGLMGANYFYLPHFPANDRMFKVALSWLFLN
jgi:hypothetical protein